MESARTSNSPGEHVHGKDASASSAALRRSPSAFTGATAARYCCPASARAADTGVAEGLVELGALTEAVGLTTCFPAELKAEPGGCHPTRATITTAATARNVLAPRIQRAAWDGFEVSEDVVVDHAGGAEAGHTEAATAAASRRAGAAVDPSWGRRYHRPHAIRDPGDGSLHVKDGTLNWSSRFSAHAHVVTIALPHGR